MGFFLIATSLSAFLLFQVQPIISRLILPAFGGSPAVWTACMTFFQAALFIGYLYAHLQVRFVPAGRQPILHGVLLLASLTLLPLGIRYLPQTQAIEPALGILVLLTLSVGLPFILIAASAPLLQHWFAGVFPQRSPYRLYALSNLGSLLALVSYPIWFEPNLTLAAQANSWSLLYLLLIGALFGCGYYYFRNHACAETSRSATSASRPVSISDRLLWISLAACGSILLLAITNQMSQNIAVVPFLWVLPLCLYLVTFIICFDKDQWYRRIFWWPFAAVALLLLVRLMFEEFHATSGLLDYFVAKNTPLAYQVLIYCLALFAGCMICHGELVRRRPGVEKLTSFYLLIAAGGALGGAAVNFIAPRLFTGYWELHGVLVAISLLAAICWWLDRPGVTGNRKQIVARGAWSLAIAGLAFLLFLQIQGGRTDSIYVNRNFFGVIYVDERNLGTKQHVRALFHGNIKHGRQFMYAHRQERGTTYYGKTSGVGVAIRHHPKRLIDDHTAGVLHIGGIGLGAGTIATHTLDGDRLRFYEIDSEMEQVARQYFTYLSNSKADVQVVLGDARISMRRELERSEAQQFDVLAIDAFSGDSIPVHLLTEEAFQLYLRHLKSDGILAIHITNEFIDFRPVLHAVAERLGLESVLVTDPTRKFYEDYNDWILMSADRSFMQSEVFQQKAKNWKIEHPLKVRWTDDFSSLFELLNWGN